MVRVSNASPIDRIKADKDRLVLPLGEIASRRRPWEDAEHNYGVYFLFSGDELQYVGKACSITDRLLQHRYPDRPSLRQAEWFDSVSTIEVEEDLFITAVECYYIHTFRPPRNIKYPIPGPLALALLG